MEIKDQPLHVLGRHREYSKKLMDSLLSRKKELYQLQLEAKSIIIIG